MHLRRTAKYHSFLTNPSFPLDTSETRLQTKCLGLQNPFNPSFHLLRLTSEYGRLWRGHRIERDSTQTTARQTNIQARRSSRDVTTILRISHQNSGIIYRRSGSRLAPCDNSTGETAFDWLQNPQYQKTYIRRILPVSQDTAAPIFGI